MLTYLFILSFLVLLIYSPFCVKGTTERSFVATCSNVDTDVSPRYTDGSLCWVHLFNCTQTQITQWIVGMLTWLSRNGEAR